MFGALARKVLGTPSERRVKGYRARVAAVSAHEKDLLDVSDENLRALTGQLRDARRDGKSLDHLLPYAFALVREASRRVLGQRHFDVQLIGGFALFDGCVAEMRTGEGKTLVATLAAYLLALDMKGVHVVTVNDYLARRDAEQMARVYGFLGLSVGLVVDGLEDAARRAAYACDITYATNSQLAFDYLRDNLRIERSERVQRGHAYAIVDEVDSILIDEARSPLIISGLGPDRSGTYATVDAIVRRLGAGDRNIDEAKRSAVLSEDGMESVEALLREAGLLTGDLYDNDNSALIHNVNQAVVAQALYRRDRDYVVRDGKVVIIDPHTGRPQPDRRFSDGLHQAIEAKEGVEVQPETQTVASVTYQNFFRLYGKLAGMTGTAATEADELMEIYGLEVVSIPTNRPVARLDEEDDIYRSTEEKYAAIVAEVDRAHGRGQPVLVGTSSVEQSDAIAERLVRAGFVQLDAADPEALAAAAAAAREGRPHRGFHVLNARMHGREAHVVAEAGAPFAVTVATNMAGRGTDIKLGGSVEVRAETELADLPEGPERAERLAAIEAEVEAARVRVLASGEDAEGASRPGGLYVIGSERHESRRIDNQLRGRSGRQGDPGRSRFFLSLQDDLVRVFGGDGLGNLVSGLGLKDGEAIAHPWATRAVERAQGKIEGQNYKARKEVLKYDDVINDQRKVAFKQRDEFLDATDLSATVAEMLAGTVDWLVEKHLASDLPDEWDLDAMGRDVAHFLAIAVPLEDWAKEDGVGPEEVGGRLHVAAEAHYAEMEALNTPDLMRRAERHVLLNVLDNLWREHLDGLEHLRHSVAMRGYAQRDPLQEFRSDAYNMFDGLIDALGRQTTSVLMRTRFHAEEAEAA
jgi:preprotein translocase subunit SecA